MSTGLAPDRLESGVEITPALRALWLACRKTGIGASDAAAIVGAHPYRTPLDVYLDKSGLLPPEPETFPMWFGTRMEPVLAEAYERETNYAIERRQVFVRSPDVTWCFATLDGVRADGRIVELKTVGSRARDTLEQLGEPGTDEIPAAWMYQVQWQMEVAGRDVADVAVLVGGGDFRVYTVERHPMLVEHLGLATGEFWQRLQAGDPPPPTAPGDLRHMTILYRDAVGELDLSPEVVGDVNCYEQLGLVIAEAQKGRDAAKLAILRAMGTAAIGRLPGGREVRRKVVQVKAHEVKASEHVRITLSRRSESHGAD